MKKVRLKIFLIYLILPFYVKSQNCILVPYQKNSKFGFKNCWGEIVTENKFEYCFLDQNPNFYRVVFNSKYGVIDNKGKLVIQPIWNQLNCVYFLDTVFVISDTLGNQGLINVNNSILLQPEYNNIYYLGKESFLISKNRKYFLFNLGKNKIVQLDFEPDISQFSMFPQFNKYNRILLRDNNYMNWCIDTEGRTIVSNFKIHSINDNGDFIVVNGKKYGVYNANFVEQIPIIYSQVNFLNDSLYIVRLKNDYNIINKKYLSALREWDNTEIYRINDKLYQITNSKKNEIYTISNPHNQIILSSSKLRISFSNSINQYYIFYSRDSSILFNENKIVKKFEGEVHLLNSNLIITNHGEIFNLSGDLILETNSNYLEVIPTQDINVIEVNSENTIRYINLITKQIISEIKK